VNLFQLGDFTLHSGNRTPVKFDCDALTDDDLVTVAFMIARLQPLPFGTVEGVPTGGLRLAKALEEYCTPGAGLLIVDDVLSTGDSMEQFRAGREALGAVIFSRTDLIPLWITPLFKVSRPV
jgi:orotate phosphoribosyltransferase